jgi:serine/threonine protein kinase
MQHTNLKIDEKTVELIEASSVEQPVNEPACMSDPEAAEVLGDRWSIVEMLGYGGMGTVFKVRDRNSGKVFAIKLLHKHLRHDNRSLRRFEREAKAATAMTHPHIAAVYDCAVGNGGVPYLLMDCLEGLTLKQLIASSGPINYMRAIDLVEQVCDALTYAHARGIIHRDIKPGNLLIIEKDGGVELAKLFDFGIARAVPDLCIDLTQGLTQTGEMFGSPYYMAPEQCKGESTDERTDIHALGVLLYEAVTGQKPYQGRNSFAALLNVVGAQPPDFPESLNLPADFINVVMKCLEKDPGNRYQSAAELSRDLAKIREGKPIDSILSTFVTFFVLNEKVLRFLCLMLLVLSFLMPSNWMMPELRRFLCGIASMIVLWKVLVDCQSIVVEGLKALGDHISSLANKRTRVSRHQDKTGKGNLSDACKLALKNPLLRLVWLISFIFAVFGASRTGVMSGLSLLLTLFFGIPFSIFFWRTLHSTIVDGFSELVGGVRALAKKMNASAGRSADLCRLDQKKALPRQAISTGLKVAVQSKPLRMTVCLVWIILTSCLAFIVPRDWKVGHLPTGLFIVALCVYVPFVMFCVAKAANRKKGTGHSGTGCRLVRL